jgi:hypothetical protein
MQKITLAVATAAAMMMAAPLMVGSIPAKAESLKMAQIDVQVGRDRDEKVIHRDRDEKVIVRDRDERFHRERHHDKDVTVGIGSSGVVLGRDHCRTVTTMVDRDNGRRVKRTERHCD